MSIRAMNWAYRVMPQTRLQPIERAVLACLAYHHNEKTGECFPSMATIGEYVGVRERRVRDAIRDLEAWGLICTRRKGRPGAPAANRYALFGEPFEPRQTGTKKPVQTGPKMPVKTGTREPVSNRPPSAADKGIFTYGRKEPGREEEACQVIALPVGARHA
jgi:hypothetical protein